MRVTTMAACALVFTVAGAEAATLFRTPTRSTWTVARDGKPDGKVELSTSGNMARADWAPATGSQVTLIGRDAKVWVRGDDGDVELKESDASGFLAAVLLPVTTSSRNRVHEENGQVATYNFGGHVASYVWDGNVPASITVRSDGTEWQLRRTAMSPGSIAAATFEVRPRQGRGGRFASMAGNLLGPSDKQVSATAGVSGVDPKGIRLQDGGDWAALEKAEEMKEEFAADGRALSEFQKSGGVGAEGGPR